MKNFLYTTSCNHDKKRLLFPACMALSYGLTPLWINSTMDLLIQGKELNSFLSYGNYWAMHDLYLTATQRTALYRLLQDCDDQADPGNLTPLTSGPSSGATGGPNATVNLAIGRNPSKHCSPLNFEMVAGREPFHPSSFGN